MTFYEDKLCQAALHQQKIIGVLQEALEFYAKLKDRKYDEPHLRREFGCGCCAGVNDANGCVDSDKDVQGQTAREALEVVKGWLWPHRP